MNSNDIIVTAQRRNERIEDVPMTVAVVSQETLAASGVNTFRDLQNVTTGLQIGNSGSYPQPAIRGITTTNAGAYENNVAVFVDGLYQATPQILNMDLPNVQDIQILKGPQGTLYGRNATGGALIVTTIDPGRRVEGPDRSDLWPVQRLPRQGLRRRAAERQGRHQPCRHAAPHRWLQQEGKPDHAGPVRRQFPRYETGIVPRQAQIRRYRQFPRDAGL